MVLGRLENEYLVPNARSSLGEISWIGKCRRFWNAG